MKCPKCQLENRERANFCNECGYKFESTCPECGATNRVGSKFCDECGSKLTLPIEQAPKDLSFDEKLTKIQKYLPKGLTEKILSQRDRIEGERKLVTVMFCDMEGFTSFSERVGPEETYTIMDKIFEILIHKVHDFEGTVNEMTGDGIMALFGAPIALEDAPQRAIRAGYAIHREMNRFSAQLESEKHLPPVKMRIGIHTGPVVVGTLGNNLRVEFTAVGDTVNLASRMEGIAEAGTTYVTEDTFKLTEGLFRFEGLGDRLIKGKEKPIRVYRVLAPSTSRTRFDVSSEMGLTPFVGRERELELMLDGFERVKDGRGQAFSMVAEAGLGKSRLLYEFRKSITNENVTFLEGKCLSYSRDVAYHPVIDILKTLFKIKDLDEDFEIKNKVTDGLQKLEDVELAILPFLLDLISIKDSSIDEFAISPEAKRVRTFEALRKIVLKGSERRPLIIAVEDLHWIDKSSEEFFKYLLEGIAGARILLIFTYRPEFVHTWGGRSYHNQVTLNRLSNRESLVMVYHLLGIQDIERNLEAFILKKTEGVPFFIEEFIKSLKDLKGIERKEGELCLSDDLEDLTIPSRIQDVIMARVDSLPEGAKEILQLGSVIGREFGHDLIVKIIDFSEQKLFSYVSILKDSELLYERGIYPQSTYIFKHALTQESVYQSLLKSNCQKYHRLIAEVLEQHFPETMETQPEILGYHFQEAGLAEKTIAYFQQAGDIAIRRSANVEGMSYLMKGLENLKTLPESSDRNQHEINLQIALGVPLKVLKGNSAPEVEQTYKRARELCQKVGDTSQLFTALWGLWLFYLSRCELQTARDLGNQLLHLSKELQNPDLLLESHHTLWTSLFYIGEFALALEHVEKGAVLYDPKLHRSHVFIYAGHDSRVCCQAHAACTLWFLGYPDKAINKGKEALIIAEELNHAFSLNHALIYNCFVHTCRKEYTIVQKYAERSMKIAIENDFQQRLAASMVMLNWVSVLQEGGKENINKFCESITTARAMGLKLMNAMYLVLLAEAYLINEQIAEGLTVIEEAKAMIEEYGVRCFEAELYRIKAELIMFRSSSDRYEAESNLQKAIAIARHQHTKSLELRAAMSLSRLWKEQGKKEEARCLLSEIYGWFTEGFDTADLKEAKVLLEELS